MAACLHVFEGSYRGNEVSGVKSLVKTRGLMWTSGKTESRSFMSGVAEVPSSKSATSPIKVSSALKK